MGILQRIDAALTRYAAEQYRPRTSTRSAAYPFSLTDVVQWMSSGNARFPVGSLDGAVPGIDPGFVGYVQGAYQANGIVFACEMVRFLLFSEARFQYRRLQSGRPGEMFGDASLAPLERPWQGGTTGDLLSRMLLHADFAGTAFPVRRGSGIRLLRPDWTMMVLGSMDEPATVASDVDAELIGLIHFPGGQAAGRTPEVFRPGEFGHFAPIPDPLNPYRGMSWMTPIIREVQGDSGYTAHKLKFLEQGATVNLVVSLDKDVVTTPQAFEAWVDAMEKDHKGLVNAYKTLYLGAGAVPTAIGSDMVQMDFKAVQGAGETRIAAAAGVPAAIVGISEGLQGSSLNAGNYTAARRRFADGTMRPLWRNAAGSLAPLVTVPAGAELWYDDRDVSFLQEDVKDAADIQQKEAMTIRQLVDAGFDPDVVIDAVTAGDLKRLSGNHSGLYSVQLQKPGSGTASQPTPTA